MRKIGLLVLALVLVLGTLGVGYAAWFDTLYIEGQVTTGTVDINVMKLSGTWVYKSTDRSDHTLYLTQGAGNLVDGPNNKEYENTDNFELISSSAAGPMLDDDDLVIDDKFIVRYDNLFPCQNFTVDFLVKYEGTIPVHLQALISGDEKLEELAALAVETNNQYGLWVEGRYDGPDGALIGNIDEVQMHGGDEIYAEITIHLPQTQNPGDFQSGDFSQEALEGLDGLDALDFSIHLFAVQWNEADLWTPPAHPGG